MADHNVLPTIPDPYVAGAQARFQAQYIKEAATYLWSVDADDEVNFFPAAWKIYQDRWPAPYGRNDVRCYKDFVFLVRQKLEEDGAPKKPKSNKAWMMRYSMDFDLLKRVEQQKLLDSTGRVGILAFSNPLYKQQGSAANRQGSEEEGDQTGSDEDDTDDDCQDEGSETDEEGEDEGEAGDKGREGVKENSAGDAGNSSKGQVNKRSWFNESDSDIDVIPSKALKRTKA
ncbi:hypothetical protein BJ165DRAFT_1400754 [Panaeolus papilionaceus]|nr:hypothetical protein BJ165DRAFT_1400754 [Panaeolus papilionaceus]